MDIDLTIAIAKLGTKSFHIFSTNACNLVWSFSQMLAHHTITGCVMNTGDLIGSGTISGTEASSVGSFLEATENGKLAIELDEGISRMWLDDGDEVIITGYTGEGDERVGFGECSGHIVSADMKEWKITKGRKVALTKESI